MASFSVLLICADTDDEGIPSGPHVVPAVDGQAATGWLGTARHGGILLGEFVGYVTAGGGPRCRVWDHRLGERRRSALGAGMSLVEDR